MSITGVIFPGIKWQGHEADHSPPYSAEVKNGGATCLGTTLPFFYSIPKVGKLT
jgi:hypothetical protein